MLFGDSTNQFTFIAQFVAALRARVKLLVFIVATILLSSFIASITVGLIGVVVALITTLTFAVAVPNLVVLKRKTLESYESTETQLGDLKRIIRRTAAFMRESDQNEYLITTDTRGTITSVNQLFLDTFQLTESSARGLSLGQMFTEASHLPTWPNVFQFVRSGCQWSGTDVSLAEDPRQFEISINPVFDRHGKVDEFAVRIAETATECLLEPTKSLNQSNFNLDIFPAGLFQLRIELDGRAELIKANQPVVEWLGVNEGFRSDHFEELFSNLPLSKRADVLSALNWAQQNSCVWTSNTTIIGPRGEEKVARLEAIPITVDDGSVLWNGVLFEAIAAAPLAPARVEAPIATESLIDDIFTSIEPRVRNSNHGRNTARFGLWEIDLESGEHSIEASLYELFNIQADSGVAPSTWRSRIHPDQRIAFEQSLDSALRQGTMHECRFAYQRSDDETIWVLSTGHVVESDGVRPRKFVGFCLDVTDSVAEEDVLRDSVNRQAQYSQASAEGIWEFDFGTRSIFLSRRFQEIVGKDPRETTISISDWLEDVHPDDRDSIVVCVRNVIRQRLTETEFEFRYRADRVRYLWVACRAFAVRNSQGAILRIVGAISDIDRRKTVEAQLVLAATTDELTGLYNRREFVSRLKLSIEQAGKPESRGVAVLMLDLDGFKLVNDSLGHDAGDRLLKEIARRLKNPDIAGPIRSAHRMETRFGGDEFLVLLTNLASEHAAIEHAKRINLGLQQPVQIGSQPVSISASIGIAFTDDPNGDAETLIRDADYATYEAKRQGKNRWVLFDEAMRERVRERMSIESDLRHAISANKLHLAYQPIVNTRTGETVCVEALARWNHPTHGPIPPSSFIPVAEESDLILSLGEWALGRACAQLKEWQTDWPREKLPAISVNVSRKQLQLPNFVDKTREIVANAGIDPRQVHLEITESAMLSDSQGAQMALARLKEIGFMLDLDDFGSGFTSLSELGRLQFDLIKIDRCFIQEIGQRRTAIGIIDAIRQLAGTVRALTVAEGVETQEQYDALRRIGIDRIQGYYFSKPLSPEDAIMFCLQSGRTRQAA